MLISINFNHAKTGELFTARAIIAKDRPDVATLIDYVQYKGGELWESPASGSYTTVALKVTMPENSGLGWVNDVYREIKKYGGTR